MPRLVAFRDLQSAPRDGTAIEIKHGPAQEAVSLDIQRGRGETEPPGDFSRDSIGAVDNNRLFPSSQRGAVAVLILTHHNLT